MQASARQRERDETRLARALSAFLREQRDRVIDNPDWEAEQDRLHLTLLPMLRAILKTSYNRTRAALRAKATLFDIEAWIESYTFELVAGITETTRRRLQDALIAYFEAPETMGSVREAVGSIFGADRAQLIAVTEVTRSYSAGSTAAADELRAAGFELEDVWQTSRDDLVCEVCGPLHNRAKGDGWITGPPDDSHPGCRCWVVHRLK